MLLCVREEKKEGLRKSAYNLNKLPQGAPVGADHRGAQRLRTGRALHLKPALD